MEESGDEGEGEDGSCSMWDLRYEFEEHTIVITEDWSGEGSGLAGMQWLGGVLLSRFFDSRAIFPVGYFSDKRCIELGAGCGLTSIILTLLGAEMTITDMDTEKCVFNVERNIPEVMRPRVKVQQLVWAETPLDSFDKPFDLVCAGDCIYDERCIVPLLQTITGLADRHTQIYVCGTVGRSCWEEFHKIAPSYFQIESIDVSSLEGSVGNRNTQADGHAGQPTQRALMRLRFHP